MEIIDSHTHVDNVEPWVDPPEKLIGLMDEANIQKAVIMTYCDTPIAKEDGLDYIIASVKKFPDRLIGYARLHPQAKQKAIALLEEVVRDHRFMGLKFHPESNKTRPYHEASLALIRKAGGAEYPDFVSLRRRVA
ncbi:amidohydrolase family protein [Cohnella rhizosphaerae]|uniref:Amidohydrolase-related domain-containing protein n=1 Tax=Cohnella rhizosphaerae TaxID=1457232 RepID=A0A9X4QTJ8_9BACL|nr:hypothetical protein [Cohnella rhizosphaerae]MDG0810433.1 hypothetical protein [Cohnella rhizosphaerae]